MKDLQGKAAVVVVLDQQEVVVQREHCMFLMVVDHWQDIQGWYIQNQEEVHSETEGHTLQEAGEGSCCCCTLEVER
jgi:hypothetical protein